MYLRDLASISRGYEMPQDWKGAPPHAFVASYRLEVDRSFTRVTPPALVLP